MKKFNLTLIAIFTFISIYAQNSNVILFTENGEKFTVILNGLRQNSQPETNVKIVDLNATQYKLKVIFDDAKLGESNFNLFLEPGTERSISISKNKKGNYTMRLISDVPVASAPPAPPTQTVYNYNNTGTPAPVNTMGGVSINMNMSETGGGINMNTPEGNVNMNINMDMNGNNMNTNSNMHGGTPPPPPPPPVPGYNGTIGCPYPMNMADFNALKSSIGSKSFEDSKLTIAKQGINNNCLTTMQVKEILSQFTFEDTKLQFAKYAYDRVYDVNNYFKINDAFTFESSIEELNEYMNAHRK